MINVLYTGAIAICWYAWLYLYPSGVISASTCWNMFMALGVGFWLVSKFAWGSAAFTAREQWLRYLAFALMVGWMSAWQRFHPSEQMPAWLFLSLLFGSIYTCSQVKRAR